ncbi:MAG: DNA adenine methylase [Bacteroidia bacterium]
MTKKIYVPPIKIQGKKTKLLPFILNHLPVNEYDTWIEPFMGSGVVGFNIQPTKAVFADSNPHIIRFYQALQTEEITPTIAKKFLQIEGKKLAEKGQNYYNEVRSRFNETFEPLDFLFLNRSCFNGMIRFNKKLAFNVPYGHKPERFAQAYITKIVNQIHDIQYLIKNNDWTFLCQDFRQTLQNIKATDLVYCDPPYIGRHVDYYDSWNEEDELCLVNLLQEKKAKVIISTWHSNQYRKNEYLQKVWGDYAIATTEHFYHVGAKEENRNPMTEALLTNYQTFKLIENEQTFVKTAIEDIQLSLFE